MASMVIRNIPDDVMRRFKAQAKAEGKSAEELGREAIADKAKPSREEILRRMDELRARAKPVDLETAMKIMEEAKAERDSRPYLPGTDDDR